jgi:2-amino-4-hydroxy-6-hydroxymethyldihydropteridine diphosphokinase
VTTSQAYIVGLGSNLGSRVATFEAAARLLDARDDCSVLARSPIYTSTALRAPPQQAGSWQGAQPDFLNAALAVHSTLPPHAFLHVLLELEAALGRVRRERWGPRAIDLDCLWGSSTVASAELTLPHPELEQRSFALAPLLDVASALCAPHAAQLHARYAPVLAALRATPSLYSAAFSEPSLQLEAHEELVDGALRVELCARGPLEEAAAALLGALGARLAQVLALPAACTQLSAHVAGDENFTELASTARLHALVGDAAARAQAGLCFGLASVATQLLSARWIGANTGARAEPTSRLARQAIEVTAVEITGEGSSQVCASASLMISMLGDSSLHSLS